MDDTTYLYRIFNEACELLYIGITYDLETRFSQHSQYSRWWKHAHQCHIEEYDTRREAEWTERQAIINELPIFNTIRYTNDRQQHCYECGEPVYHPSGVHVWCDFTSRERTYSPENDRVQVQ